MEAVRRRESGQSAALTVTKVDLIDDETIVASGLQERLRRSRVPMELAVHATSWLQFSSHLDFASHLVVIKAELVDHVPLILKIRALSAVGSIVLVLAEDAHGNHQRRSFEAGAAGWIWRNDSLDEFVASLERTALATHENRRTVRTVPEPDNRIPHLTDRELQVLCLYAGQFAPSAAVLAATLALSERTVRAHLANGRSKYRELGRNISTRGELRKQLYEDGWLIEPYG